MLNPATGKFTVYRHSSAPGSLSSDEVDAVCIDHAGAIWVGTHSGLDRFDRQTGTFADYTERDGLPNSNLTGILEDNQGNLWLSTNNGLSRFDPRTNVFKNYSISDGLLSNEFFGYNTPWKSASGEMFFGSYAGLVTFFPGKVVDNPVVPPVVLTDFQIFGHSVPIGEHSPLKKSIAFTDSITLSHRESVFTFEFSALSYISPGRNRYRHRLEPVETQWIQSDSTRRSVTYTSLPPGEYVFRVQGSNNRGIWNETGVTLRIRILPPWWSTWWFRTGATVLIVSIVWLIYFLRVRSVKKRNRELMQLNAELQQSQRDLRESEGKLAEAQRIAHVGHWDLDLDSRTVSWSDEAFRIHGMEPQDLRLSRQQVLQFVHPEDLPIVNNALTEAMEGATRHYAEFRVLRPNGQVRIVQVQGNVTKDESGQPNRVFGTIQDITERKLAEQEVLRLNAELEERVARRTAQLAAVNKDLEEFASSISHDLRAPLLHIGSFSKILMEDYLEQIPVEAQHFLSRIEKESRRMGQMVDGLLNFSRVGRQQLSLHEVKLDAVVQEVVEGMKLDCKGREVEWKIAALPAVQGDEVLLRQVFVNLISNALKFTRTRAKAVIEIGEATHNGRQAVFVRDNGVGFDMQYAGKLYRVFHRLHRAEDFEGTGVGLATVQRIMHKHGGRIWAEAEVDRGATFYLTFGAHTVSPPEIHSTAGARN
jgi:PAS domain S-box-containing protein